MTSEEYAKSQGRKTSEDNAWFEAFAPCQNPEIVVVALFEKFPGHGQYAAPIVRDVIKAYFDKKLRQAQMAQATARLNPLSLTPAPKPADAPAAAEVELKDTAPARPQPPGGGQ